MANCKCTLIQNGLFYIIPCWYEETNAMGVKMHGFDPSVKANVLYSVDYQRPEKGDYIIVGEYESGTIESLMENGALKVMSVAMLDFGTFPHYEIGLKK